MSKVVCDICGTEYPEFDDFCPNCGCSQDVSAEMDMELEEDNFLEDSPITAVRQKSRKRLLRLLSMRILSSKRKKRKSRPEAPVWRLH